MKLNFLSAGEIIRSKENTSLLDIAKDCLDRIDRIDKDIKAFVYINRECINRVNVKKGNLAGIPIAIKDNICVKDELTTCASKILEGFKSPYDATVIEKLKNEGAVLLGKTNMDEFAFGSSCETSYYGPSYNPWDKSRIPGGSSGGSACAVSADETIMALGSDTGGSIRQPASLCGVVGLKPTYGRVSRYGLIAFASSLDQIGPITKTVEDCALLLNIIAGYDERDSTSVDIVVPDYTKSLVKDVKDIKIGIPKEYFLEGLDLEVKKAVSDGLNVLKELGARTVEISLPHTEYALSVYYILAPAEASSNLARFDGVQYGFRIKDPENLMALYRRTRSQGFGKEAKRRIILGTYSLSSGYYDAYYLKALKVRTLIKKDFDEAFKLCDCIITPTSPTCAFRLGEKINKPLDMYLSDIFTIPVNLAGLPAISIPCGFNKENLPIGLQIIGKPFDEETLFRAAYTFEQSTEFHKKKPKIKP
ncbi:MAG: Asp-tRNA(Asn)/Glu-tRNA(Gln) amidotransferase subunit GatA [Candidatus Omnitrophica bacterium]|nr:Asp-tRNA(Asn)/Glu-tRNA(Gln) amidotransferase subunit GatA [Candidatus Omnitrophota bacterium]